MSDKEELKETEVLDFECLFCGCGPQMFKNVARNDVKKILCRECGNPNLIVISDGKISAVEKGSSQLSDFM